MWLKNYYHIAAGGKWPKERPEGVSEGNEMNGGGPWFPAAEVRRKGPTLHITLLSFVTSVPHICL